MLTPAKPSLTNVTTLHTLSGQGTHKHGHQTAFEHTNGFLHSVQLQPINQPSSCQNIMQPTPCPRLQPHVQYSTGTRNFPTLWILTHSSSSPSGRRWVTEWPWGSPSVSGGGTWSARPTCCGRPRRRPDRSWKSWVCVGPSTAAWTWGDPRHPLSPPGPSCWPEDGANVKVMSYIIRLNVSLGCIGMYVWWMNVTPRQTHSNKFPSQYSYKMWNVDYTVQY